MALFNYFVFYKSPKSVLSTQLQILLIQREGLILISNSIFELAKTLVNNIRSPKPKLHFYLLNLHFKLLSKYELQAIFYLVYKNYFHA